MLQTRYLLYLCALVALPLFAQVQGLGVGRSLLRVMAGAPLELRCDPAPQQGGGQLEWTRPADPQLTGFEQVTLEGVRVLRKGAADVADSADYTCRSTRTGDTASVQVIVFQFIAHSVELPKEYKSVTLRCTAELDAVDTVMTWRRDGDPIVDTVDKYVIDVANNSLTVLRVKATEIGPYMCGFELSDGEAFSQTVYITAAAHIRPFDKSKNLIEGDRLTLDCGAWGYPAPVVTWAKNQLPLDVDSDPRISFADLRDMTNATLRIEDLHFGDIGDYNCSASNVHGQADSTLIRIRVKDKLAALWPFVGICVEVIILCVIIYVYERRHAKKMEEEDNRDEADHLTNSNDHKGNDEIRQRK